MNPTSQRQDLETQDLETLQKSVAAGSVVVAFAGTGPFEQMLLDGRHALRADEPQALASIASHRACRLANVPLLRKVRIASSTAPQRSARCLAKAMPSFSPVGTCIATRSCARSLTSQEITGNSLMMSPMRPASRSSSAAMIP